MRKVFTTLLTCLFIKFAFSQSFPKKQTLLPLNNISGVPFYKDQDFDDLIIDGFEIDNKGNLYFMSGEKNECLAMFSGTKQAFRKKYPRQLGAQLYLYKNNLYTFDRNNSDLLIFNPSNGLLIKKYSHITDNQHINSYTFADSSLILGTFKDTSIFYERYNLQGKFVGQAPNEFNLNPKIFPDKDAQLLGIWNNTYVFWDLLIEEPQRQKFWLVNKEGKVLATKSLINKGNLFGTIYFENPNEHRKVRNGNLYVLGRSRTGNNALITEVPLQTFFYK